MREAIIKREFARRLWGFLRPPENPSMLEWACANVVIPDGPHKGSLFSPDTQPFARLFFEAIDSGKWERIAATGPSQTGKSLICYVIPVCYHLFAIGETVVAGIPTADMAADKWREDFLPVIEASPTMRDMLPTKGAGSRSGKVSTHVKFRNGATLRFMSGGGNEKSRAGFTSRVLAITEVDGMDEAGKGSVEADKIKQLEARQRAYLATGIRTYLECTVTESSGRIWQEYENGTQSRISRPCPHCGEYVTPEREHLTGWEDAENEFVAADGAAWTCPECGKPWSEPERYAANSSAVLAHRGQAVTPGGEVQGDEPLTKTLGFRWTAADNHFATAADVGVDEWEAKREADQENAEKELSQFVHCIPYDPPDVSVTPLDADVLVKRTGDYKKGIVPPGTSAIAVGIDIANRRLNWTALALDENNNGFVIDYGEHSVNSKDLGVKVALGRAFAELSQYLTWQGVAPAQVWMDSGYYEHRDPVFDYCIAAADGIKRGEERYRPMKGYGEGQRQGSATRYFQPRGKSKVYRYIGEQFYLANSGGGCLTVHVNADHWKSRLHQALAMEVGEPGSIRMYEAADPAHHQEFIEQLTAERQEERYIEGHGLRVVWERVRKSNHWLDSTYMAYAAATFAAEERTRKAGKRRRSLAEMAGR